MKFAIAAILKDENDSLLEWLAFHRVMGASHFFLADNGSTDGTREFLASLAREGWVTLIDVPSEPGVKPQLPAYQRLLEACGESFDAVAFIDADEFLLPEGEPEERGLLPWLEARLADPEVGAVAVNWACFGSGGARFREEGLVIERFTRRAKQGFGPNHHFKSIVRPSWVVRFSNPHLATLAQGHYVDARGAPLEVRVDREGNRRPGLSQEVCWQGARVNHYLVKSVEEFVLDKARRGSAATPGLTKHRAYFERHDRNDEACLLAASWAPAVNKEIFRLEAALQAGRVSSTDGQQKATPSTGLVSWLKRRLKGDDETAAPAPWQHWALDYPSSEREPWLTPSGRVVQGWVLLHPALSAAGEKLRIVAEWNKAFELCHPLEIERPDVVEQVLQVSAEGHPQRQCGFRFTVPRGLMHFRLWLVLDDKRWLLHEVRIAEEAPGPEAPKVLPGRQGWLFLDNDTNGSVDQFTGRMRLTSTGLSGWREYLAGARGLGEQHGVPWVLLISPAKESVMGARYHPRQAGAGGPMAQLMALPEASDMVYPVEALQALGDGAFIPTDTHWTHHGAMEAAVALATHLGLSSSHCRKALAKDRYKLREMGGDLGNKLTPRRTSRVEVLTSFNYARYKTYDNGLPNFGRLLVIEYPKAVSDGVCLIFGSSSSYSMFNYLCRFFRRIVFVHSAGSLDQELIASVRPDFLVAQTNARFVVQVPVLDQVLDGQIRDKVARLSKEERELVASRRLPAAPDVLEALGVAPWERIFSNAW